MGKDYKNTVIPAKVGIQWKVILDSCFRRNDKLRGCIFLLLFIVSPALAQTVAMDSSQPIEIAADTLEVLQNEQKAVFSGNVVATQGQITMKAARMLVYYKKSDADGGDAGGMGKGISRLEADGGVTFSSLRESARGSRATYEVNQKLITMTGDVLLTRDKNVLKGTQLVYNLTSGRSVLSSGGSTSGGGGRVKGLFVPSGEGKR